VLNARSWRAISASSASVSWHFRKVAGYNVQLEWSSISSLGSGS
jgi:hypothetical protein